MTTATRVEVSAVDVQPGAVRWRRLDTGAEFTLDPENDYLVEEWLDGDALRFYLPTLEVGDEVIVPNYRHDFGRDDLTGTVVEISPSGIVSVRIAARWRNLGIAVLDTSNAYLAPECSGHPSDDGVTFYCDASCRPIRFAS